MKATKLLFGWCRMPDVADPEIYLVAVTAILDEYPQEVRDAISDPRTGTRLLKPFPSPFDIRDACDKAYEPIERQIQRDRAREGNLSLPAPAKPSEARRDEQIADYEQRIKPVLVEALKPLPKVPQFYQRPNDGKHFERVAADLAARKRPQESPSTDPPKQSSAA
jgi:hypothetical protein